MDGHSLLFRVIEFSDQARENEKTRVARNQTLINQVSDAFGDALIVKLKPQHRQTAKTQSLYMCNAGQQSNIVVRLGCQKAEK